MNTYIKDRDSIYNLNITTAKIIFSVITLLGMIIFLSCLLLHARALGLKRVKSIITLY